MEKKEYLDNYEHIHLVGIGGVSMSAIAKLCLNKGKKVTGSDKTKSLITEELLHLGVKIFYGHNKNNIDGADLVIYTCACKSDNVELMHAKELGIPIIERADFLAKIASFYDNVIAVAGSHGKTTTTAMIGNIFMQAGLNPTIHIGGMCPNFNGNLHIGGEEYFITEACEYQKHLLKIPHNVGVVLNIEMDHAECYKDFSDLYQTFETFSNLSKDCLVVSEKLKNIKSKSVISVGNNGTFSAKNIKICKNGYINFTCYKNNNFFFNFKLKGYGYYNVENALMSIAVADYYKINKKSIYEGLKTFDGIKRRFEFMGKINNQIVIQDYAHHPTQITNVIQATKKLFNKKIIVVFQPHTYSRTKYLFSGFIDSLIKADNLIIMPTYSAREVKSDGYDAKKLFLSIKKIKKDTKYYYSYSRILRKLSKFNNSVILILGAGDIEKLANKIKTQYLANFNIKNK